MAVFPDVLPDDSPVVPADTNEDGKRHGKAPAFKDLKGGDREGVRARERKHSYDTFRGWDSETHTKIRRWERVGRASACVRRELCSFQNTVYQ